MDALGQRVCARYWSFPRPAGEIIKLNIFFYITNIITVWIVCISIVTENGETASPASSEGNIIFIFFFFINATFRENLLSLFSDCYTEICLSFWQLGFLHIMPSQLCRLPLRPILSADTVNHIQLYHLSLQKFFAPPSSRPELTRGCMWKSSPSREDCGQIQNEWMNELMIRVKK